MGPEMETEIITLLKDLQKQLGYLEKKIDALSRTSGRPSSPGRSPAMDTRFADRDGGAFASFKKRGPGRPAEKGRGLPGSSYPKKNQTFKPKKKKR